MGSTELLRHEPSERRLVIVVADPLRQPRPDSLEDRTHGTCRPERYATRFERDAGSGANSSDEVANRTGLAVGDDIGPSSALCARRGAVDRCNEGIDRVVDVGGINERATAAH